MEPITELKPGMVFRKYGPDMWIGVERVMLPDAPGYDGGMPGASIRYSHLREVPGKGLGASWDRQSYFMPGKDVVTLVARFRENELRELAHEGDSLPVFAVPPFRPRTRL
jgi:hypothetical protein